jgi:hypothetical protein
MSKLSFTLFAAFALVLVVALVVESKGGHKPPPVQVNRMYYVSL